MATPVFDTLGQSPGNGASEQTVTFLTPTTWTHVVAASGSTVLCAVVNFISQDDPVVDISLGATAGTWIMGEQSFGNNRLDVYGWKNVNAGTYTVTIDWAPAAVTVGIVSASYSRAEAATGWLNDAALAGLYFFSDPQIPRFDVPCPIGERAFGVAMVSNTSLVPQGNVQTRSTMDTSGGHAMVVIDTGGNGTTVPLVWDIETDNSHWIGAVVSLLGDSAPNYAVAPFKF